MGYPKVMGAGCAGSTSRRLNVNVNQIQFGDKLQGLPPVTGKQRPYKSIRAKEGGNLPDRERIYCINQLGGIGMSNKNSQFAANADGVGPCPNKKNKRGHHGLHRKHHHPSEKHPKRGISRATEREEFNPNMFFTSFSTPPASTLGSEAVLGPSDENGSDPPTSDNVCPKDHPYAYDGQNGYICIGGKPTLDNGEVKCTNGATPLKQPYPSKDMWCCSVDSNIYGQCKRRESDGSTIKGKIKMCSETEWVSCKDNPSVDPGPDPPTSENMCPSDYPYAYSGRGGAGQPEDGEDMWCCSVDTDASNLCIKDGKKGKIRRCSDTEWVSCKDYSKPDPPKPDPPKPDPQSGFALGKCETAISDGFGIALGHGQTGRGTFTTFGFGGEPGVKQGNYLTFMTNPNGGPCIHSSVAIPFPWMNSDMISMYGQYGLNAMFGNNGYCSAGPVWSKPDTDPNVPSEYPHISTNGGAVLVDYITGEPWIFKLWYADGNTIQKDITLGNNFIIVIATDLCGGDCNAGFQDVNVPYNKPGEAEGRIDAQLSFSWAPGGVWPDHVEGCVFSDEFPDGYNLTPPVKCYTNYKNIGRVDISDINSGDWTPARASELFGIDRIKDPLEELFGQRWTKETEWRQPPAPICWKANDDTDGIKEIYANSDFRNSKITRDELIDRYCEDGITRNNPGDDPSKSFDSCSGRFCALDIRLSDKDADLKRLGKLWGINEAPDAGQVLYQKIPFTELKQLIGDSVFGKQQLKELLGRLKYKNFGANHPLN